MSGSQNFGRSSALGVTLGDGGVKCSLFSRTPTGVEILFFNREDEATPSSVVRIPIGCETGREFLDMLRKHHRRLKAKQEGRP